MVAAGPGWTVMTLWPRFESGLNGCMTRIVSAPP